MSESATKLRGAVPLFVREGSAGPWMPWFAWRPVTVTRWTADGYHVGDRVWLRYVWRRRFYAAPWFLNGCIEWWEYIENLWDLRSHP